jgi:hypothetical protein
MDSSGTRYELTRVLVEDLSNFNYSEDSSSFYIEGDDIVMPGKNRPSDYLRIAYYIRPSEMVEEDRVATITNITSNSNDYVLTVNEIPSVFTVGATVDITDKKKPFGLCVVDSTITAINQISKQITITRQATDENISVDCVLSLSEECIVPQIPVEVHSLLAQRVVCRCLESLGVKEDLSTAMARVSEMESKLQGVLSERVEGAPLKIISKRGFLKQYNTRRR